LSEEQAAIIDNLAASSEEIGADQQLASRDLVKHMLEALKPAERLVIELQYLQEKSVEEIRSITGWSSALVRVRAFRARQKLKGLLSRLSEREAYGQAGI
jgi:RNA polymerase sigma-70 factor (ECF subfamily)